MKHVLLSSRLPALAVAVGYLAAAGPALAQATAAPPTAAAGEEPANKRTVTYLDLSAGAGYSSNPLLRSGSSIFGRVSLTGFQAWNDERGSTSLTGFVEDTTYVRGGYGSKAIFRVGAQTRRAVSETVTVFGNLAFSGDVAGQLTNRFTSPPVVTPPVISPLPVTSPDIINLSGRQYRLDGQVGASIRTSTQSSVSLSAGASHAFYTGAAKVDDYTTYSGSLGYEHQLSERTWFGGALSLQRQDFRGGEYSNVVNPTLTLRTQLAENISVNGSVGLLAIYAHRAGQTDHSYSPSFTASVCKTGEKSEFCANLSRTASAPLAIGTAQNARSTAITTDFNLSYTRKIGERETIRALVTATRSSTASLLNNGNFRTTYLTGLVSYDRRVGNRLYAGISGGTRKVFQTGPDPKIDFNATIYLRYRLGDLL